MVRTCSCIKFLWLPKIIDGKFCWLKKVRVTEIKEKIIIDGEEKTISSKVVYKIIRG